MIGKIDGGIDSGDHLLAPVKEGWSLAGPPPQDGRLANERGRPRSRRSCRSPKHKPGERCGTPTSPGTERSTIHGRARGWSTTTWASSAGWQLRSPAVAATCGRQRTSSPTSAWGRGAPSVWAARLPATPRCTASSQSSPRPASRRRSSPKVKGLIAAKVVKNDRLKLGVMSFDGKGTWSRADGPKVEGARQSSYDADGSSLQTFGALRAVLSSSSVCPCVGQKVIGSKEGEATAFRELLPRVCDELGGQFRIVTGDAGLCARENAALVSQLARWYVFGLKGNQPHLYGLASQHRHYSVGKPLARTVEKCRGHTIERELYARDVAGDPEADIQDARQLWYVCQATYDRRGECIAAEQW